MRAFAPRVSLQTPSGDFLRAIPAALAQEMVTREIATAAEGNGRVKAIRLLATAESQVQRIGPPTAQSLGGVRFYRWVRLDGGGRVVEHHPRALY